MLMLHHPAVTTMRRAMAHLCSVLMAGDTTVQHNAKISEMDKAQRMDP
jgi:hypothetical protein